jgi:integrase
MLSDLKITKTKPDPTRELRLSDGEGLHIALLPNGKRFWRWDYTYNGRRKQLSFGKYPRVTLKHARERKLDAQRVLDAGTDPSVARQRDRIAASTDTFAAVAEEWLAREAHTLHPKTFTAKKARLEQYLLPALGALTIRKIAPLDVLPLLQAIERRAKHDTAHRVRQMASEIFRFAVTTARAETDPAALLGDALKPVLTRHHPAITDPVTAGQLLQAIDHADGSPFIAGALRLAPLVFVRPGELRGARWTEIDLDAGIWKIPAARMKPTAVRVDHVVPLSRQAVAILRDLQVLAGPDQPLVFPGVKSADRPISDATLPTVLRRLGYSAAQQSVHGFRTLASTHLREIGFENDLVELQLSHKITNPVRAAYDKAARIPERVRMMQAWADHLDALKAGAITGRVLQMPAPAHQVAG